MGFMALPHTVTVQSVTTSVDGVSGRTSTYATRQAGVACRILNQSGNLKPAFQQNYRVMHHAVYMTYGGTMPGDRLLVTNGPSMTENKYLRVVGIAQHAQSGGISEYVRLDCEQEL